MFLSDSPESEQRKRQPGLRCRRVSQLPPQLPPRVRSDAGRGPGGRWCGRETAGGPHARRPVSFVPRGQLRAAVASRPGPLCPVRAVRPGTRGPWRVWSRLLPGRAFIPREKCRPPTRRAAGRPGPSPRLSDAVHRLVLSPESTYAVPLQVGSLSNVAGHQCPLPTCPGDVASSPGIRIPPTWLTRGLPGHAGCRGSEACGAERTSGATQPPVARLGLLRGAGRAIWGTEAAWRRGHA